MYFCRLGCKVILMLVTSTLVVGAITGHAMFVVLSLFHTFLFLFKSQVPPPLSLVQM